MWQMEGKRHGRGAHHCQRHAERVHRHAHPWPRYASYLAPGLLSPPWPDAEACDKDPQRGGSDEQGRGDHTRPGLTMDLAALIEEIDQDPDGHSWRQDRRPA